jgi:hypothetical protein
VARGREPAGACSTGCCDGFQSSEFPLLPERLRAAHAQRLRLADALQEAFIRGQAARAGALRAYAHDGVRPRGVVTYLPDDL